MAVHRDNHVVGAGHILKDAADEVGKLVGNRVADSVGDVDCGCAGLDHLAQHATDEVDVRTSRVHRRKLDVAHVLLGASDHLPGLLQDRLTVLAQLMSNVNVGGREEDVNARILGVANRLPALVDVVGDGAAERGDLGPAHFAGDAVDGVEVGRRGGGEAGLDAVDAHFLEQLGNLQLLLGGEGDTGGLLAVTQGGIKDSDSVSHGGNSCGRNSDSKKGRKETKTRPPTGDPSSGPERPAGDGPRFSSPRHTRRHGLQYSGGTR